MPARNVLQRAWERLLEGWNINLSAESQRVERAIGMGRLYEQLWVALDKSEQASDGWPYPLDIYLGDDGVSLFSIVAQNGKLYQVSMSVNQDTLTLGTWTQVTEAYEPVSQNRFSVRRQKDGKYRWTSIAATTVLNRSGELDSCELFDSFIQHAEKTGNYPRLDFYHLGSTDPETWEFGTADYLARDGFCYIASGTFDEEHPLAKATIQAYERDTGVWGNSIEFYAWAEPEIILLDPKIQVPIYKEGENTRISVVKEEDAASLFTRIGVLEEKKRTMNPKVEAALKDLFGDDEDALMKFIEDADTVNTRIVDEKLIHRAKKDDSKKPETPDLDEDEDDTEDGPEEDEDAETVEQSFLDLDDVAISHIAQQVLKGDALTVITQNIEKLTTAVATLSGVVETGNKEVARLKSQNSQLTKKIEVLSKDDAEKKQTWAEDLPARKTIRASYRPKEEHGTADEDGDEEESMATIAERTLSALPGIKG